MALQGNEEYNLEPYSVLLNEKDKIKECINKLMSTLSFRKLAGKTQVILSLSGPDIRTRLTHTIEVARIARDICDDLKLNADLAEAIALAHDIGHTPFGHVGERTLREIMCGCDTLGDKVEDYDFANSGFKHNLQSFRVLYNFEQITKENNEKIWPYILWGAIAHSKQSWAKLESGLENEILISPKHCDWVYVCNYHKQKECKRNIQEKKNSSLRSENQICKPWFCARLSTVDHEQDVDENDLNKSEGETRRDYIKKEYIKKKYQKNIYCRKKCYLAKLWNYRKNNFISIEHPYLFDHPFPNSFYSKSLHNYLYDNSGDELKKYFSVEAVIVSQADEIAQRQQDLEDGINKGLLTFQNARAQVENLMKFFNGDDQIQSLYSRTSQAKKPDELGKLLVEFYRKLIVFGTRQNFFKFENDIQKININIYALLNILYSMYPDSNKKSIWIMTELKNIQDSSYSISNSNDGILSRYFNINYCQTYLYLLSYHYLEECARKGEYLNYQIDILEQHIKCLEMNVKEEIFIKNLDIEKRKGDLNALKDTFGNLIKNRNKSTIEKFFYFLRILDNLRDYLKNYYRDEYDDYFIEKKKKLWKKIGDLNLQHFSVLYLIYENYVIKQSDIKFCAKDLTKIKVDINHYKYKQSIALEQWKKSLTREADRVFNHLVNFVPEDDISQKKKREAIDDFEKDQKNIILKSEAVEKNDGKASYILTRLFKAYISNSHQLPDSGLKYIVIALQDKIIWKKLKDNEKITFNKILQKLEKTMIDGNKKINEIKRNFIKITKSSGNDDFNELKKETSNEVKAALDKRRELYKFLFELERKKDQISKWLNSEEDADRNELKNILRKFRAILDNPFLNATPFWKSILTRGICDYIAGLTDQEALNEYEKLYAGIMELV